MANTGDIMATNAESYDTGRKEGYVASEDDIKAIKRAVGADPSDNSGNTKYQRRSLRKNPDIVRVGDNQLTIRFRKPGPALIETGLPMPIGKPYYISTEGLIPNLQVGRMASNNDLKFEGCPASKFIGQAIRYMLVVNLSDAKMVFSTDLVPDGEYQINIREGQIQLFPNEYAPNVPVRNLY
jgi:hypothetical protein